MDEIDKLKEAYLCILSVQNKESNLTDLERQKAEFIRMKLKILLRQVRERNAKKRENF